MSVLREREQEIDRAGVITRFAFALSRLRPGFDRSQPFSFAPSLSKLPFALQARRRILRRRDSGKRSHHRVRYFAGLRILVAGDRLQL